VAALYHASVDATQSGPPAAELAAAEAAAAEAAAAELAADQAAAAEVVSVWRAIAASHAAVCSALERELGERHGLGVSDFEVLERLAESVDHQFRAQELADAVHLSQSALSRLISRLEKNGLVERCMCDLDRRGIYVTLTEAGRQRHAEAAPTHRDVLSGVLSGPLLAPAHGGRGPDA